MQELIPMIGLIAAVMVIAYVARRSQTVGLPPGVSRDRQTDPAQVEAAGEAKNPCSSRR